jgi:hypothetical protein
MGQETNSFEEFTRQELERVNSKLYVIKRIDLRGSKGKKNISEIGGYDVPDLKKLQQAELCYFEDDNGTKKILKNRYDVSGIVITNDEYIDYMRLRNKEKNEDN